jgi:hypothetical protein
VAGAPGAAEPPAAAEAPGAAEAPAAPDAPAVDDALGPACALWPELAADGALAPAGGAGRRSPPLVSSAIVAPSAATPTPAASHVIMRRSPARGDTSVDDSEVAADGAATRSTATGSLSGGAFATSGSGASPVIARASASAAARAVWNRSAGARAHARANQPSSVGGSSGTMAEGRGSVVWIASVIAPTVTPSNGRAPVSASNATTPSDQMSLRASTASPRICSGLM